MLRTRVIPVVLLNGYSVIKTIKFDVRRNLGNPITVARVYNTRNVDELVLLDIDASKQGRGIDLFTVQDIARECFMPLAVGGGIRSISDIKSLLQKGADKIIINTIALENPDFIQESASVFGCQCIVVSVDIKIKDGQHAIYSKVDNQFSKIPPVEWCQRAADLGAGELFINFVDHDGALDGIDESYIKTITESVGVPVIGCGGISTPDDAAKMAKSGASGVAAASIFHFTNYTPLDCKKAMAEAGFPVRL
jgi:cyclase